MNKLRKATMFENLFEKSFFILWIVSWFAACWIFPLQFFFTGLFAFILCAITVTTREIKPKTHKEKLEELNTFRMKQTKKSVKEFRKYLKEQTKKKRVKKK